ncbi:hypothetical protein EST38_g9221 [Candolleomyces aberdarensis]|uniref:Uncharacterized protein n=1 Tax=Candolleomyces aberdarensis TaxID=2316362 RepID=A0A4Q2DAG3_9AGAR|nr:hypothetical protein EST38_g9221 [Candolleomyces aberdarensis]
MAEGTRRDHPFAIFLKPPANESSADRATREARASEAKKRSDAIDEELRKERRRLTKTQRGLLKVVLVGDSGSGREKMVKQLRMRYAREEWDAELARWKSVIQLRILKGVVTILDALQSELDGDALPETSEDTHSNGATEVPFDTSFYPDAVLLGQLERSSSENEDTDTLVDDDDTQKRTYVNG